MSDAPRSEWMNIAGACIGIGMILILGFVTWALVFRAVPQSNENAFLLLIGILSANVGVVVGFFFGTSVANRKKDETIANLANNTPPGSTTVQTTIPQGVTTTTTTEPVP